MVAVWIILGLAVGAVVGWLAGERKARAGLIEHQTNAATAQQRADSLGEQLQAESSKTHQLHTMLSQAETRSATLAANLESTKANLIEQRKLLDDAHAQLARAFASVSAEALAKNNEAFLQLAKEKFATLSTEATGSLDARKAEIDGLLKPMREVLGQYQTKLGEIEKSRVESYAMLREQLGSLTESQRTLNTQTTELVGALRRPQTRGQWGEVTLRRLVELAGMSNRCDFVEQMSLDTEEGRQRPDMVLTLPGERMIIIDSKASLDAFLDATAAADDDSRKVCLQRHCQQVKQRSRELSAKSYWSQFKRSPEFVIMFLPGEAFLYAAIEQDGALIEDCLKNRVIIATPTTLMALLRAIELGWRQEQITLNAEEIRKHGKDLYERIAVVADHFSKLGDNLNATVNSYNKTLSSLEKRVLVSARKIGELGARTDKELAEIDSIDGGANAVPAGMLPLVNTEEI